jgi:hypothetical protein
MTPMTTSRELGEVQLKLNGIVTQRAQHPDTTAAG